MPNNLKREIEKDFDKDRNYNTILSKVEGVSSMKKFKLIYALAPVCVIIIAVIGFSQSGLFKKNALQMKEDNPQWKIKEVYLDKNTIQESMDIAIVPKWEEMTISQQFNNVKYSNNEYLSKTTKISNDKIGKNIGTTVLTGYDTYTNMYYDKKASVYEIKDLLEECAIALQFEGDSDYYVYVNSYYRPETLKDFMEALNLKQNVLFGTLYYDYWYTDEKGNKQYENIEFPDVDDDIVWKMLFDNLELENVHSDGDWHNRVMSISVDIPLLGYKNIAVSVTEDGYLTTNILDTGKAFYIGKDKVQRFVNYILENYDGYKIVYVYENGEEIRYEEDDTEGNVVEEKIMVTQNKTVDGNNFVTEEYIVENKNVIPSNRTEANDNVNMGL